MDRLEIVASYLRENVLIKHSQKLGRSHCGIDAQRSGIALMIAMGIARPAFAGDAWDIVEAKACLPIGWSKGDIAATIVDLAFNQKRLRLLPSETECADVGAGFGLNAAFADASTISVLEALGLVQNQIWAPWAFEVFQTAQPLSYLLVAGINGDGQAY